MSLKSTERTLRLIYLHFYPREFNFVSDGGGDGGSGGAAGTVRTRTRMDSCINLRMEFVLNANA